jgi:hypothetical protein
MRVIAVDGLRVARVWLSPPHRQESASEAEKKAD